jgi:hypothetical protein
MRARMPELGGRARTRQQHCDTTIDTALQKVLGRLAGNKGMSGQYQSGKAFDIPVFQDF